MIGTPEPVHAPLRDHGPRARTRRYTRALVPALVAAALVPVVLAFGTDLGWLAVLAVLPLLLGLGLGVDRARSLGHALVDGWLVARSGSLTRKRELLATDAIIGWNLRSTWFQRRAGLATLVATTAGGSQSVTVLDVPEPTAVDVAATAVPDCSTSSAPEPSCPARAPPRRLRREGAPRGRATKPPQAPTARSRQQSPRSTLRQCPRHRAP